MMLPFTKKSFTSKFNSIVNFFFHQFLPLLQSQVKTNVNNIMNNKTNTIEKKIETSPKITRRMERLIDEKCNLLSKSGISKEGTVHLAQWMKGQFNKQACASEPIESDEEENSQLQDWSVEDVRKRSSELNLIDDSKKLDENVSEDEQKSVSKSTTSDSQVSFLSFHLLFFLSAINQCQRVKVFTYCYVHYLGHFLDYSSFESD